VWKKAICANHKKKNIKDNKSSIVLWKQYFEDYPVQINMKKKLKKIIKFYISNLKIFIFKK